MAILIILYQNIVGFKSNGSFRVGPIAIGLAPIFNPYNYRDVSRALPASQLEPVLSVPKGLATRPIAIGRGIQNIDKIQHSL